MDELVALCCDGGDARGFVGEWDIFESGAEGHVTRWIWSRVWIWTFT